MTDEGGDEAGRCSNCLRHFDHFDAYWGHIEEPVEPSWKQGRFKNVWCGVSEDNSAVCYLAKTSFQLYSAWVQDDAEGDRTSGEGDVRPGAGQVIISDGNVFFRGTNPIFVTRRWTGDLQPQHWHGR